MMRIIVFFLAFGTIFSAGAQKIKYSSLKKVTISDPGQLYSTYNFDESEMKTIRAVFNNDVKQVDGFVKYSNESSWPEGLSTLDGRSSLQDAIRGFHAYKLAMLDDKYVLLIPKKKNKRSGVKFTHDIYMIVGKSGITE